ncbi:hypothetical protein [Kushneria indalinina]|uniref:Uncharacterized protein n=1 Tax=Kushneria indalinina DSM 14324 TaxID=1122140 RepID=A0A3D9E0W0_9GAMM|nr:hypothetical protein [Kushneria indalinina]REC96667.1 hypothetical protein C8D72_0012 [Kushneria indalinina DSM 14324]
MADNTPTRRQAYLTEAADGLKSVGGIIAGASLVGGFISEQFGPGAGFLGLVAGLGIQQLGAYGKAVVLSSNKPSSNGGGKA